MRRTRSSGVSPEMCSLATKAPSRRVVTRRQSSKISSSRWEMNSTAQPCPLSASTTVNSRATSLPDSAAVGSSMMRTRASRDSALAISTSCWSAMDRPRAGLPGSSATPRRLNSPAASRRIARRSMRPNLARGWRPMKMFSSTERSGKSVGSW